MFDLIVPGEMLSREHLLSMMPFTAQDDLLSSTQHLLQDILDKSLFLHSKNGGSPHFLLVTSAG